MGSEQPHAGESHEVDSDNDRLVRLETEIGALHRSLSGLDRRLANLETAVIGVAEAADTKGFLPSSAQELPSPTGPLSSGADTVSTSSSGFLTGVGWTGRSLLGLAGGYLLRSFSSEGIIAPTFAVALGLIYAALWLVFAARAKRSPALIGTFCTATSAVLGLPLIWEATTSFDILVPWTAALALAILTASASIVAWRSNLALIAWIYIIGSTVLTGALGGSTESPVLFAGLQVLIGIGVLWLAEARSWSVLPWIAACAANLLVFLLWSEEPIARGLASVSGVVLVQISHFVAYAASSIYFAFRLDRYRPIGFAQAMIAVAVGLGGAAFVTNDEPVRLVLGITSVFLAITAYSAGFVLLERGKSKPAVSLLTTLACLTALIGSALIAPHPAIIWSVLAVGSVWLGNRRQVFFATLQGGLFASAGIFASGAFFNSVRAWIFSNPAEASLLVRWESLATIFAIAALLMLPTFGSPTQRRVVRTALLALCTLLLGGCAVFAGSTLISQIEGDSYLGWLAAIRTSIVALLAIGLALLGRSKRFVEAGALVYPVLVLGAVKMLIEDLMHGNPETLFIGFAIFGAALVIAPRLRPRAQQ